MDMKTKSKEILKSAIELVLKHKEEIDKESDASIHRVVLEIKKGDSSKENLRKWFILITGPGWRGGPPPNLEKRRRMLAQFENWYNKVTNQILPKEISQNTMDEIYRATDDIEYIGPKIAGVFLRDVIIYLGIWPQFTDFLYLPIDRHTRNVLVYKLGVFGGKEVPNISESYFTSKNQQFQEILNEVHKPRVEFDYFWVIGSKFCSYFLCDFCWISGLCKDKSSILQSTLSHPKEK